MYRENAKTAIHKRSGWYFSDGDDRQCVTQRIYPSRQDALGVSLFCKGGSAKVLSLNAWDMAATNPW
jgi:hypothetical protein